MTGLLTRRRISATLGAVTMFVAACGGGGGGSPTPAGPTQNPNAAFGGTLNLGVWQAQNSFLNAGVVDSQTFSYLVDAPSAEGLLWYRSGQETKNAKTLADYWAPDLATEVPTTDNGDVKTSGCPNDKAKMCVTWKLRSGVKWADGSDFSSHDVCDTFALFWTKYGSNNPTALLSTSGWQNVLDCKETDKLTATVDFSALYGPYLALGSGVLGILPGKLLDQAFTAGTSIENTKFNVDLSVGTGNSKAYKTPAGGASMDLFLDGTGPYVMSSFDANTGVTYVINKNYWGNSAGHQPHLDSIVFKYEADLPSEVTAIKSGAVEGAFDMRLFNLQTLLSLQSQNKLSVQAVPDSGAEKVDLNLCDDKTFWVAGQSLCGSSYKHSPYLANKDVRKALLMGINRPSIVTSQTAGQTTVPKDSFLYLGAEYIDDPSIPQTSYDLAGANALLDKDGFVKSPQCDGGKYRIFSDGTCMTLSVGTTLGNPSRAAAEQLIDADLQNLGIKPGPSNDGKSGVFFGSFSDGGTLYTHNFDLGMYTNTLSAPAEPDSFYTGYVGCYDLAAQKDGATIADCSGANGHNNNIPSALNNGNGQDDTGINDPVINQAMSVAETTVDLTQRTQNYIKAEKALAADIPEIPLYRQVTVDAFAPAVQGVLPNDLVWDYNSYDWWCTNGKCQGS